MKTNTKRFFSSSTTEREYFKNHQDKIEIVSCIRNEMKCKEHLLAINKNYRESDLYRRDKNFQKSIEELKNAFYKTTELADNSCLKCSSFFRSTITDSLKSIKNELKGMTTGFFSNKHYQSNYIMIEEVIQELEEVKIISTVEQKKSRKRFIESYPKKNII